MKEIKDKQAVAKLLNQDIHIKGGGVMNLKTLAPKVEKIVDKDPSDDVEEFPYEYVKLPDFEYILTEEKTSSEEIKIGHIDFLQTTKGLIFQANKGSSVEPIVSGPSRVSIKAWSAGSSEVTFCIYIQNKGSYIIGDVTIDFLKRGENIPANTYYAKNIIGIL